MIILPGHCDQICLVTIFRLNSNYCDYFLNDKHNISFSIHIIHHVYTHHHPQTHAYIHYTSTNTSHTSLEAWLGAVSVVYKNTQNQRVNALSGKGARDLTAKAANSSGRWGFFFQSKTPHTIVLATESREAFNQPGGSAHSKHCISTQRRVCYQGWQVLLELHRCRKQEDVQNNSLFVGDTSYRSERAATCRPWGVVVCASLLALGLRMLAGGIGTSSLRRPHTHTYTETYTYTRVRDRYIRITNAWAWGVTMFRHEPCVKSVKAPGHW